MATTTPAGGTTTPAGTTGTGTTTGNVATIPDELAKNAINAITLCLKDLENQRELYRDADQVTITLLNDQTYTGPSLKRIMQVALDGDVNTLGAVGAEILKNRSAAEAAQTKAEAAQAATEALEAGLTQSATDATNAAAAAATSEKNAKDSETASGESEKNAKDSENAAKASQTASATSQANASGSANAAAASESAAAASQTAAKASEDAAAASALAAKASENAAASSASDLASAVVRAEGAMQDAYTYSEESKTARNEAQGFRDAASTSATAAANSARAAAASVSQAQTANKFTNAISVGDAGQPDENVVDFVKTPTINGVPIVASAANGESHYHTDQTCTNADDMNDAQWQGKTFMVQKPIVSGAGSSITASNNAPAQMGYDFCLATDFYAGWTPGGGAKGRQRVQMIYDRESIWIRGFHQELGTWTGWKRIATQLKTDVTGTDLNTLILTGHYSYLPTPITPNAPKIDATEASSVYFLDVFATDNGDDIYQVMHSPNTNSRFDRYRINGNWSRWWNTTATFDVDTAAAGVDLNTITNPGWWGVPLDTARNLPTGAAYPPAKTGQGVLEVIGISNGGTLQRLHYVDDGDVYYRNRPANNGTVAAAWSPWKVEAKWDESRILPVTNGGTGVNSLAGLQSALGLANYAKPGEVVRFRGGLAAGQDLNSLGQNDDGWYVQAMTANATTALNYPTAQAGYLYHIARGISNTAYTQFYYPYSNPAQYFCRYHDAGNNTWTAWQLYVAEGTVRDRALVVKVSDSQVNSYGVIQARYRSDADTNCFITVAKPDGTIGAAGDLGAIRMGGNRATGGCQIDAAYQGSLQWYGTIAKNPGTVQSQWACTVEASGSNPASSMSIQMGRDHSIRYNAGSGGSHFFGSMLRASGGLQSGNPAYLAASGSLKAGYRDMRNVSASYYACYPDGTSSGGVYVRNSANSGWDGYFTHGGSGSTAQWGTGSHLATSQSLKANTIAANSGANISILLGQYLTWGPATTIGKSANYRGTLNSDGNIYGKFCGNTTDRYRNIVEWANATYTAKSDPRVKKDITPLTLDQALNVVKNAKTYQWSWKENGYSGAGFLGNDPAIAPYTYNIGDVALEGGEVVKDCIGLDSGALGAAVLTPVVKMLLEKVEALEAKIAQLEASK